jgi:hypothetical protein
LPVLFGLFVFGIDAALPVLFFCTCLAADLEGVFVRGVDFFFAVMLEKRIHAAGRLSTSLRFEPSGFN